MFDMVDNSSQNTTAPPLPSSPKQNHLSSFAEKLWEGWQSFCRWHPEDDFVQILRKTSAAVSMVLSPLPLAFGLYFCYAGFLPSDPADESILGAKIVGFLMTFWSINAAIPYIYLYFFGNGSIPTTMMDVNMFIHSFFAAVAALVWPGAAVNGMATAVAIITILSQSKFVIPLCLFLTVTYSLDVVNKAYRGTSAEVVIPGARYGPHAEQLLIGIAAQGCVFLASAGVFAQSIAHVKHVSASRAAVDMSREIVNLLRRYNTEGVTEALKQYDDDVDPDLVKSLKQMNDNLETYKPFLPNYLFQDEEEAFNASTTSEGAINLDTTESEFMKSAGASLSTLSDSTPKSSSRLSSSDNSGVFLNEAGGPGSAINKAKRTQGFGSGTHKSSGAQHANAFEGHISFAMVEVPSQLHGHINKATAFVECVFDAAEVSKGSVHSLVGNVATITWNATHRVAQPELKAAKFLHHLRVNQALPFGATVFSGIASCFGITSSKKQHASIVIAPWLTMASETFQLACEYHSMLMDDRTASASANYFTSTIVDYVASCSVPNRDVPHSILLVPELSPTNRFQQLGDNICASSSTVAGPGYTMTRATAVFELLGEIAHDEQEWMYQLESKDNEHSVEKELKEAAMQVFSSLVETLLSGPTLPSSSSTTATGKLASVSSLDKTYAKDVCKLLSVRPPPPTEEEGSQGQLSLLRRLENHMRMFSL